jgi:hypothetical protein
VGSGAVAVSRPAAGDLKVKTQANGKEAARDGEEDCDDKEL